MKKWTLIKKLASGYRVFRADNGLDTGSYAICDQSGDVPHEADDGVLWLDPRRPLKVGLKQLRVPVRDHDEDPWVTIASPNDVIPLLDVQEDWEVELTSNAAAFCGLVAALELRGVLA